MPNRIQTALESVRAEESIKENTRIFLEKQRKKAASPWKTGVFRAAAAACCLALLGTGGYAIYAAPVSAVSLEAIPEIRLEINCFDRVVSAEGLNEEGTDLLAEVSVGGLFYGDALESLLSSPQAEQWLEGEAAVVTVSASSPEKQEKMQEAVAACEPGYAAQVDCYGMNPELWQEAEQAGLSAGKYQAFLEWQALDPSVTAEDAQDLSMREIREKIQECENAQKSSDDPPEASAEETGGQYGKENGGGPAHSNTSGNGSPGKNNDQGNGHRYGKQGNS